MSIIIGLLGGVFTAVYYISMYYRFESRVEKEKMIHQDSVEKVILKTRICGIIIGISATVIVIPTTPWKALIPILILWITFVVWGLTVNTRRGIERLEMKYGKK